MLSLSFEGLHHAGPLLALAVVLVVGLFFGSLARRVRLPAITGQIVAGVLMGRAGLDLFHEKPLEDLQPLTHFALGLMAVTVGAHLNVRRLRNAGKRLFFVLVAEATIVPLVVFSAALWLGGTTPTEAALFGACSIATAPATIVAVVREARAKGVFVKTLVGAVAFNNMGCIFLFEVARAFTRPTPGGTPFVETLAGPLGQLLLAAAIGGTVAVVMELVARYVVRADRLASAAVVGLLLTSGLASFLGVSPLLACLFLGFVQTNLSSARDKLVDSVFSDFQPVILAVFFTLAGMHLSLEHAAKAGVVAALVFAGRAGGKWFAASLAMHLAHATERVRRNLGVALVPQAGVAVALVILIQDDPDFSHLADFFSSVVLTVVTINEIVGPIATRAALARAGEVDMDRLRLMDFLQEENIVTDFHARTKEEAIEELVDLLISSHHMDDLDREALLDSVLQREAEASTCFGGGLAVPHGLLPEGQAMVGVMGISREGIPFETPDRRPVHCMVLLATSPDQRDRHLQVLATLARTVGSDPTFQAQIFNAKSPAHASELLHGDQSFDFNYFLEDDEERRRGPAAAAPAPTS